MRPTRLTLLLALLAATGCGDDGAMTDSGGSDGGGRDSGLDSGVDGGGTDAGRDSATADAGSDLDISVCDPATGDFTTPLEIDNPFFPLPVGKHLRLEGGGAVVDFTVLDMVEVVEGVMTRVIEERETEDGELIEVSRNWFAQTDDGTVCYFGEDVDIYEGGVIVRHDGAWRAGVAGAMPGIQMPAMPEVGQSYFQEVAPGVAQDHAEVVAMGETLMVPLAPGTFTDTLEIDETSPLEPGSHSLKIYIRDIGMAVDDDIRLTMHDPG